MHEKHSELIFYYIIVWKTFQASLWYIVFVSTCNTQTIWYLNELRVSIEKFRASRLNVFAANTRVLLMREDNKKIMMTCIIISAKPGT